MRCRTLLQSAGPIDAVLLDARIALRERSNVEIIGSLSRLAKLPPAKRGIRDILLGAALARTRDFDGGRRLIERALKDLRRDDEWFDEATYQKAAIAWMRHDDRVAEDAIAPQLASSDPNSRARAHILLSWVALRRSDTLGQVAQLLNAFDQADAASNPDQFIRANALLTLALLCRELPLREVAQRVRQIFAAFPWTSSLQLGRFQVTRFLATIDELEGNTLAAFAGYKHSATLAPSDHWRVMCMLDRARLAKQSGESAFAADQLLDAHELAGRLSWNDLGGEECSALVVLAELFADVDPTLAEQYLVRFRELSGAVSPAMAYASDPRAQALGHYSSGLVWLHVGDADEAKAALLQAWSTFEEFRYGWRAALCALRLGELTGERTWYERARQRIAPWPRSWIARDVAHAMRASGSSTIQVPAARRRVLELLRAGKRNSEIASALGRSPHTVRNQIAELFRTFDVSTRAELVALLATEAGPAQPPER